MKVFIINGAPGSGKTTFEEFVQGEYSDCAIISTVDYVKTVAKFVGWDGTKTLKNRKFLSDLKDLLTEWEDIPFINTIERCKEYENTNYIVFIDCREPDEIERLCIALDAQSIVIRRDEAERIMTSNHADANVLDYYYDIIIDNNGTLNDLKDAAKTFLENF